MKDLDERLRVADQVNVPDRWEEIERRIPSMSPEDGPHRWVTLSVALLIGIGVIGFVVVAIAWRSTPQTPARPAPMVTNGQIAYAGGPYGGPQIIVMDPDGTHSTPLTSGGTNDGTPEHPFPAWEPAWSPDGTRIAFRGFWGNGEGSDLFVMDADGSNIKQLTQNANVSDPAWSPDGNEIAVSAFDGIYVIDSTGGLLRRVTPESTKWHNHPTWSPDGTLIAYDSLVAGTSQIFLIGADGTAPHPVTDMPKGASMPSWSPDGSTIAFVGALAGDSEIYFMRADGADIRRITTCGVGDCRGTIDPTWAPDGSRLLFVRGGIVYAVEPDGSGLLPLTNQSLPRSSGPSWQPIVGRT